MPDRENVIKGLEKVWDGLNHMEHELYADYVYDALALLKEQENLLGIHQTANSITFISTGTAQQGESRGISLGKLAMHEWLKKELLYRGLFNDDIRAVFDLAQKK